eukprot:1652915-Pleurochrysis_carterae.AAC.1
MLLADGYGKCLNPPSIDDENMVAWLGTADGNGILTKKNVQRSWDFACKNERGRKLEKHIFTEVCAMGCA